MLVGHEAAVLYADDIASKEKNILPSLREFLKANSSAIVLHDYKKHLALFKSLGILEDNSENIRMPLLDTRLASYLLEPDFRADTIETVVEHYLDINPYEGDADAQKPEQGELDLLLDDETTREETKAEAEAVSYTHL